MSEQQGPTNLSPKSNLRYDLPSGLVVFLVALPLCLGIALASGAPLFAGLIAGIVGGLIVPLISNSALSVSGPAAGLTAIVLVGIKDLGGFNAFLVAIVIAGLLQLALGLLKAGGLGSLVPVSVIKGMLAAIGVILILKQFPHAIGYDVESFGADAFAAPTGENTFSLFLHALSSLEMGALTISAISLGLLILWANTPLSKISFLPGALVVVVVGTGLNILFGSVAPSLQLEPSHLVALPPMDGFSGFLKQLHTPQFSAISNPAVWSVAVTIALVASIETLLCIEAVDKLDPYRRRTNMSRELIAQGIANTVAGMIGGLPVTSVIVRSSANINSGGRTKAAAFLHAVFLVLAVVFLGKYLNMIPLACLAAILLQVGYKLAKPSLFRLMYKRGNDQFVPFITTVLAILFTDLLRGVIIGLVVGLVYVLRNKAHGAFTLIHEDEHFALQFNKDVSFMHKPALSAVFRDLPDGSKIVIDGTHSAFIDFDIKETVADFLTLAPIRRIEAQVRGIELASFQGTPGPKPQRRKIKTVQTQPGAAKAIVSESTDVPPSAYEPTS